MRIGDWLVAIYLVFFLVILPLWAIALWLAWRLFDVNPLEVVWVRDVHRAAVKVIITGMVLTGIYLYLAYGLHTDEL